MFIKNGTFDNSITNTRQVFVNGILACNIPSYLLPFMRDSKGNKVNMLAFGHFEDFNNIELNEVES